LSREIVDTLAACVKNNLGLLSALSEALPEPLWTKSAGGWPAWQHILHAINGTDLFTPGPATPPPDGVSPDVLQFKMQGSTAPINDVAKGYLAKVREKVDSFIENLSDDKLLEPNEGALALGLRLNLVATLALLSSHTAYHLGHGDALLRLEGLPGIL
jgi:hypothetical protein